MNEIKFSEKDYRQISELASKTIIERSFYNKVYEIFRVEILVNAIVNFCNKNNIIIGAGKIVQVNPSKYKEEFTKTYNLLDAKYKYEYVIKRQKVDLLHRLELAETKLAKKEKEFDKLKKEHKKWS